MKPDATHDLPFDQYQRYRLVADVLNAVRGQGERLAVLDVGGRTALLRQFLPDDEVFLVDVEASAERGLVLGDGSRLPYATGAVDAVVTFDTLEHVPPPRREAFLAECARVARRWVVVAGPYAAPRVDEAEELLTEFLRDKLGQEHRYLAEHRANGLPDRAATEGVLRAAGAEVASIGHANVERWLAMMCLELYLDRDAPLRGLAKRFFRFYNSQLYASDHAEPVYRHAVVAAFDGARLPDAANLLAPPVAPAGALDTSMEVVRDLLGFDLGRDAVAKEWARLEGVNRDLELDLEGHKRTLLAMREVYDEQRAVIEELRGEGLELVNNAEDLEAEIEREREEGAAAVAALSQDLAEHRKSIVERESDLDEHKQLVRDLEAQYAAERAQQAIQLHELNKELAGTRELAEAHEAEGARLREENERVLALLAEEREAGAQVVEELGADLAGHRDALAERGRELEAALEAHAAEAVAREAAEAEREGARHAARAAELVAEEVRADAAALREVLAEERELRRRLDEVRETLARDLDGHRAWAAELQREVAAAQEAAAALDAERHAQTLRADHHEARAARLAEDLAGAVARAEAAEEGLRLLHAEHAALAARFEATQAELAAEREVLHALRLDLRKRWSNLKRALGPKPTFDAAPDAGAEGLSPSQERHAARAPSGAVARLAPPRGR